MLGLRLCARALSSCGKRGPLPITAHGPLTIAASLVAEHRLSNCGSRAQPLRGTWDPPRPGPEPASPALAGRLSTTAPPGKPFFCFLINFIYLSVYLSIYSFLAALGLPCCARTVSSCGERGLLFVAGRGLLIAVASLVACRAETVGARASVVVARGLSSCGSRALEHRLSSCGARAYLPQGVWDLPGPGLEPVFPALAGGFLTTAPPGKPCSPPFVNMNLSVFFLFLYCHLVGFCGCRGDKWMYLIYHFQPEIPRSCRFHFSF